MVVLNVPKKQVGEEVRAKFWLVARVLISSPVCSRNSAVNRRLEGSLQIC